jgi:hypothetical protein
VAVPDVPAASASVELSTVGAAPKSTSSHDGTGTRPLRAAGRAITFGSRRTRGAGDATASFGALGGSAAGDVRAVAFLARFVLGVRAPARRRDVAAAGGVTAGRRGGALSSSAIRVALASRAVRSCSAGCHSQAALRCPPFAA